MPAAQAERNVDLQELIGRDVADHRERIGRAHGVGVKAGGGRERTDECAVGRVVNRDHRSRADQQNQPVVVVSHRDRDRRVDPGG